MIHYFRHFTNKKNLSNFSQYIIKTHPAIHRQDFMKVMPSELYQYLFIG